MSNDDDIRLGMRATIARMRAALEQIAAPFDSGPATFVQAHMLASEELKRRMQIAADAL